MLAHTINLLIGLRGVAEDERPAVAQLDQVVTQYRAARAVVQHAKSVQERVVVAAW